uniref:Putative secreted protein n=1 Tax=Anopheles triannulatus TaxID=58253 RepID=A0A2M4B5I9_9DIPT
MTFQMQPQLTLLLELLLLLQTAPARRVNCGTWRVLMSVHCNQFSITKRSCSHRNAGKLSVLLYLITVLG